MANKPQSLYKSPEDKKALLRVYDDQLSRLKCPVEHIYVDTRYGKTHIVKAGKMDGIPFLLFTGQTVTVAFQLLAFECLLDEFCVYGVDVIGHPGYSDERIIDNKNYAYGYWLLDVIDGLKMEKANCFGISINSGVVTNLMCLAPERLNKVILYVPGSIYPGNIKNLLTYYLQNLIYKKTGNEEWKKKSLNIQTSGVPYKSNIEYESTTASDRHMINEAKGACKSKRKDFKKCKADTLLLLAAWDILFKPEKVLHICRTCLERLTVYIMPARGHVGVIDEGAFAAVREFLRH